MSLSKPIKFFKKDFSSDGRRVHSSDKNGAVSHLELRHCVPGEWGVFLQEIKKIEKMNLNYSPLRGKVGGLAGIICSREVEAISLVGTRLETSDFELFKDELEKNASLKKVKLRSVNLKFARIKPAGCEILAKIVNTLPDMDELILANCELDDECIKRFLGSISSGKVIKKLVLSVNVAFTAEGMADIGRLTTKCRIEEVELEDCRLNDDKMESLCHANPRALGFISIEENPCLSEKWFKEREGTLQTNTLRYSPRASGKSKMTPPKTRSRTLTDEESWRMKRARVDEAKARHCPFVIVR